MVWEHGIVKPPPGVVGKQPPLAAAAAAVGETRVAEDMAPFEVRHSDVSRAHFSLLYFPLPLSVGVER